MKHALALSLAAAIGWFPAAHASAQQADQPRPASDAEGVRLHDGFFLRMGWGGAHLLSRGRGSDPYGSYSGNQPIRSPLRTKTAVGIAANADIGGTPLPGLVCGFNLTSHLFANPDVEVPPGSESPANAYGYYSYGLGSRYVSAGGFALLYPNPRAGFNTGLTLGMMGEMDQWPRPDGFAVAPQIGYDHWLGEQWSLGFFLRATFARLTSTETDPDTVENVTLTAVGVALTYQ